ncbi:Sec-independent protein translocase subunit TatA/TatB [Mycetocola reblochoni]|uniref:Sec-independent protein translocase subunit TatA/TatB n=1 Tax=Mycetocola reblochoni TaxID=331618 RepID=UPI003F9C716A
MFGLSVEKLVLIGIIAAVIVGPQRLPGYAAKLAGTVRAFRAMLDAGKARIAEDSGATALREDWAALNPRQYDPRRIVRDALADAGADAGADPGADAGAKAEADTGARADAGAGAGADTARRIDGAAAETAQSSAAVPLPAAARAAPGVPGERRGRYVITGSSAHPRRVWVPDQLDEPVADALPSRHADVSVSGPSAARTPVGGDEADRQASGEAAGGAEAGAERQRDPETASPVGGAAGRAA